MGADSLAERFLTECHAGYDDPDTKALLAVHVDDWTEWNGLWFRHNSLVVPNDGTLRQDLISTYHDSPERGHPCADYTRRALEQAYWWPTMTKDVRHYVDRCDSCQRMKRSTQRLAGLIQPMPIPGREGRLRHWVVDSAVGLPETANGNASIHLMVHRRTRLSRLRACPAHCTAETTVKLSLEATHDFGPPKSLICDRGQPLQGTSLP